jgi:hypothetical protein
MGTWGRYFSVFNLLGAKSIKRGGADFHNQFILSVVLYKERWLFFVYFWIKDSDV